MGEDVELDLASQTKMTEAQTMRVADIAPLIALSGVAQGANPIAYTPLGREVDVAISRGIETIEDLAIDFVGNASEEKAKPNDLSDSEGLLFGGFGLLPTSLTPPSTTTESVARLFVLVVVRHRVRIDVIFITSCGLGPIFLF